MDANHGPNARLLESRFTSGARASPTDSYQNNWVKARRNISQRAWLSAYLKPRAARFGGVPARRDAGYSRGADKRGQAARDTAPYPFHDVPRARSNAAVSPMVRALSVVSIEDEG
jgi:hypothetical protein